MPLTAILWLEQLYNYMHFNVVQFQTILDAGISSNTLYVYTGPHHILQGMLNNGTVKDDNKNNSNCPFLIFPRVRQQFPCWCYTSTIWLLWTANKSSGNSDFFKTDLSISYWGKEGCSYLNARNVFWENKNKKMLCRSVWCMIFGKLTRLSVGMLSEIWKLNILIRDL